MKKNILLFLVFLCYQISLQAQCTVPGNVTFHSQVEIDFFPIQYPDCNSISGNLRIEASDQFTITNLGALSQLESIGGDLVVQHNPDLVSLAGLDQVNTIGGRLYIQNNPELISIAGLHGLVRVEEDFRLINNASVINFSGIENLEEVGDYFLIQDNQGLTSLLGLDKLHHIGGNFNIKHNQGLINLNGIETLSTIEGTLTIEENSSLQSLYGLGVLNATELQQLNIYNNPNLAVCNEPFVCGYLNNFGTNTIMSNALGCNSSNQILQNCIAVSKVNASIFYDINQNQIKDANERGHVDLRMILNPLGINLFSNAYTGQAEFFLEGGSYNIAYNQAASPIWEVTTAESYNIEVDDIFPNEYNIAFGVFPNFLHSEMVTSINSGNMRCGQFVTFNVHAKNIGTTVTNGTLWLEIDSDVTGGTYIDVPDVAETNRYGWHYEDLYPGESISKSIKLQIPGADFTGEILDFQSYSTFNDMNGDHTSRYFEYSREVRCSFDPNDKLVHPSRYGNYTLFDEDLIYTIRFQNTGNDVAYDVVIQDTLDANLDVNSFRFLSSSHEEFLKTSIYDDRYLTFEFNNIYLPDSTSDFEGSQGYVSFFITPNQGLEEQTLVTNSAGIYFDQNPPVLTNTTENLLVSVLPTTGTKKISNTNISIFPNPTSGIVEIIFDENQRGHLQVYNGIGEVILEKNITASSDVSLDAFANGVYFFKVEIEGETRTQKVVKL